MRWFPSFLVTFPLLLSSPAWAWTSSLLGGLSLNGNDAGHSPRPLLGAELTYGEPYQTEYGAFIQANLLSLQSNPAGVLSHYGALGRFPLPADPAFFGDLSFGLSQKTDTGFSLAYGIGVGYRATIEKKVALTPRLGYRRFSAFDEHSFDFSVSASFWGKYNPDRGAR